MKDQDRRNLKNRQRRIRRRLDKKKGKDDTGPVFEGRNRHYEVSARTKATKAGGVGAIHDLALRSGLVDAIDEALPLLKFHQPYHESDHVLNIAYNILAGGTCLEDLENLRQDESYMDMLGARRIPDPTTAGDFLRRWDDPIHHVAFMDAVNGIRQKFWTRQPELLQDRAVIDVDGTIVPTHGEKKFGMDISYNGIWGHHPLLVSLANTQEPLYVVNRSGNVPSHTDAAHWIDKAIDLCAPIFGEVFLRGDTDFSLTTNFDRWTDASVKFVFGYDSIKGLIERAELLSDEAWSRLHRPQRVIPAHLQRDTRPNVKEEIVVKRGFTSIHLESEDVAEFDYRPGQCEKTYRMIVLRKNLTIEKGEQDRVLFPDIRYFFYVTNDDNLDSRRVVFEANARCHQENLIEQLKNGVHALHAPVHNLLSNWAYMLVASLAWTLKAWFALTLPRREDRESVLRMEFKKFLNMLMLIPCQVTKAARKIVVRVLAYTQGVRILLRGCQAIGRLKPT